MEHTQAYGDIQSVQVAQRGSGVFAGTLLLWIAGLHQVVGLSAGFGLMSFPGAETAPVRELIEDGWLNAVEPHLDRMTAVWFLLFGFALGLFGALVRWIESKSLAVPAQVALGLALLCVFAISLMPVSGFWLGLYPAWKLYRAAGRGSRAALGQVA